MIHQEIQWPPAFEPAKADGTVSNEIDVKDLTPEDIWPYLLNLSDWDRFTKDVMDADFMDPSVEDVHIFPKAEFTYKEAGLDLVGRALEVIAPKADRPGRISWEGSVQGDKENKFEFCHAWLLVMGPHGKGTHIESQMTLKGSLVNEALIGQFHNINGMWLQGLVNYVEKHLRETNHPRHPEHQA